MKQCTKCGTTTDQFSRNRSRSDGLNKWCKPCMKVYGQERYSLKGDFLKVQIAEERRRRADEYRDLKKTLVCVDCGNSDYRVLDFDHLSDKLVTISQVAREWSMKRLMTEINKCDVVCSNCHRIRTHERRNGAEAEQGQALD